MIRTLLHLAAPALLVVPMAWSPAAADSDTSAVCSAQGASLGDARTAFAANCAGLARVDCDPAGGGWSCSSAVIGASAPNGVTASQPAAVIAPQPESQEQALPDPAPPLELPSDDASSECAAAATSLRGAIAAYEASCVAPRVDCDPSGDGWRCSSGVIGGSAPGTVAPRAGAVSSADASVDVPTPSDDSGRPTPSLGWADSYAYRGVCYVDTTYDHGIGDVSIDTPAGRMTIRRAVSRGVIAAGPGIARAEALYNDIQCGNGPANDAGDEDPDQCPGRVDQGRAGCTSIGPRWSFDG